MSSFCATAEVTGQGADVGVRQYEVRQGVYIDVAGLRRSISSHVSLSSSDEISHGIRGRCP